MLFKDFADWYRINKSHFGDPKRLPWLVTEIMDIWRFDENDGTIIFDILIKGFEKINNYV